MRVFDDFKKLFEYFLRVKNLLFNHENEPKPKMPIKILNVAEKPSAAKTIANLLATNGTSIREGHSVYNKIFQFNMTINNIGQCDMFMTSVSGHTRISESISGISRAYIFSNMAQNDAKSL